MKLSSLSAESSMPGQMAFEPLTILFGRNGVGKTSILDAVESLISLQPPTRLDSAKIYFEPEPVDDTVMIEAILTEYGDVPNTDSDCDNLNPSRETAVRSLIASGECGTPTAREAIARHLVNHFQFAIQRLDGPDVRRYLVCSTPLNMSSEVIGSFDVSILEDYDEWDVHGITDEESDGILMAVYRLTRGEEFVIAPVADDVDGPTWQRTSYWRRVSGQSFPASLNLNFDPETIDSDVEESVEIISEVLSGLMHGGDWLIPSSPIRVKFPPHALHDFGVPLKDSASAPVESENSVNAYVVSPYIEDAVRRVEARANEIAPSFISEWYIRVAVAPPSTWKANQPRITTYLEGRRRVPLQDAGSGISRWAALSLRIACLDILHSGFVGLDGFEYLELFALGEVGPEIDRFVEVRARLNRVHQDFGSLNVVLLADEPEAHLHPHAVKSVAKWISELAPRVSAVVVASHHPTFLDLSAFGIRKYALLTGEHRIEARQWHLTDQGTVRQLASEVGITAGDLLLMSKYILFVEGPHDEVVLGEFFGDWLTDNGIRVIPAHGAYNLEMLTRLEIVWDLGIPVGVLFDDVKSDRPDGKASHTESIIERIKREATLKNATIQFFGLPAWDILMYLDDGICADYASGSFPGWTNALAICPDEILKSGTKFKKWITESFGLQLDRDTVRALAKRCKQAELIHADLQEMVAKVATAASLFA